MWPIVGAERGHFAHEYGDKVTSRQTRRVRGSPHRLGLVALQKNGSRVQALKPLIH
jgi:hypothetical protein